MRRDKKVNRNRGGSFMIPSILPLDSDPILIIKRTNYKPGHFNDIVIPDAPKQQPENKVNIKSPESECDESKLYQGIRDEIHQEINNRRSQGVYFSKNDEFRIEQKIMSNIQNEIEPMYNLITGTLDEWMKECTFCSETNCVLEHRIKTTINGEDYELFARLRMDMDNYPEYKAQLDIQHGLVKISDGTSVSDWSDSIDINRCPICNRELKTYNRGIL
jgi:hypothetical protein